MFSERDCAFEGIDGVLRYVAGDSAAFTDKTKVVILNTPHNPSGKVFTREELTAIAEICTKHDVLVLADEVVSRTDIVYGLDRIIADPFVRCLNSTTA